MAIKYAENTTYGQPQTATSSINMPALIAAAKARGAQTSQIPTTAPTTAPTTPAPLTTTYPSLANSFLANYKPAAPSAPFVFKLANVGPTTTLTPEQQQAAILPYVNTGIAVSDYAGQAVPSGTTLGQYQTVTGKPYSEITEPSTKPYLEAGKYLAPSEVTPDAVFKTLMVPGITPTEGGQYLMEPSKPGAGIATTRAPLNYNENALIRQGLDPSLFQIDHIIPLWVGGADDMSNKEILDNYTHNIKSKVQAVPYTLMANGLISQREALAMASEWKTKASTWGTDNIPEPATSGLLDVKVAQNIAKEWTKAPAVTWKSFLQSLPEAGQQIYGVAANVAQTLLPKSANTAAPREFIKGFASAIPTYDLAMPELAKTADYGDKTANVAGNISHVLGAITGNVVTFSWTYKLALQALSKVGIKWAAKELTGEALKTAGTALAETAGKDLLKQTPAEILGAAAKTRAITAPAESVFTGFVQEPITAAKQALAAKTGTEVAGAIGKTGFKTAIKGIAPKIGLANVAAATLPKAALQGVIFSGYRQLQQMPVEERAKKAALDFAYGLVGIGKTGYNVGGYAKIAAPAFAISLMEGLSFNNSFANAMSSALINTGTMLGMHGMGNIGYATAIAGEKPGGILTYQEPSAAGVKGIAKAQEEAHVNAAAVVANKYRQDLYSHVQTDLKTGAFKPEQVRPEYQQHLTYENTTDPKTLQAQNNLLDSYIRWKGHMEGWTPDYTALQRAKLLVSGKALVHFDMSPLARKKAQLNDWQSIAQKFIRDKNPDQPTVPTRVKNLAANTILRNGHEEPPTVEDTYPLSTSGKLQEEFIGTGNNKTVENQKIVHNVIDGVDKYIKEGDVEGTIPGTKLPNGRYLVNGFASHEPDSGSYHVNEGVNPENAVRIYVPDSTHGLSPIGYIASEGRIGNPEGLSYENSFNANLAKASGKDLSKMSKQDMINARMNNPDVNNNLLANEMRDNNALGIKVVVEIDPQTLSSKARGTKESFFKVHVTDDSWDPANIKRTTELMVKGTNLPNNEINVAANAIHDVLKDKPEVIANYIAGTPKENIETANPPGAVLEEPIATTPEESAASFEAFMHDNIPFKNSTETALLNKEMEPVHMAATIKETTPIIREAITTKRAMPAEEPRISEETISSAIPVKTKTPVTNWKNFSVQPGGGEEINAGAMAHTDDPVVLQSFTRKNLYDIAKGASKKGAEVGAGWKTFLNNINSKLKTPITDKNELNDLRWLYKRGANSSSRLELTSEKNLIPGAPENKGKGDADIEKFNKDNNLPADAVQIIGINKQRTYGPDPKYTDSRNKFDEDVKTLSKVGKDKFLPVGQLAKGSTQVIFAKFSPEYVKIFDKNPEKYTPTGAKIVTPEDKFLQVLKVGALNLPKDMNTGDFIKRSSLIFTRGQQYNGIDNNSKFTLNILKSPTVGEEGNVNSDNFENPKDPKVQDAINGLTEMSRIDGKIILGEDLFDKIRNDTNYDPAKYKTGLKITLNGQGNLIGNENDLYQMIHKGSAIKADPAIRAYIKSVYGFDLPKGEAASFDTNAKVGPKEGKFETPLSSIFTQAVSPSEEGRVTPDFERKLQSSDAGATNDILNINQKRLQVFKQLNDDIAATTNKKELEDVLNKYSDKYNLDKASLFYGDLGESFNLGAAKINLSHNLERVLKNIFNESVINDVLPGSGRATLSFSLPLKLDGPNNPARVVNNEEIVLGKEFMKAHNIKEGDDVMVLRNPSIDMNNILVLKARDGSTLGHTSLGTEHTIVSPFNERIILGGDQDGDDVLITKVGEGGIPESYVNAVKTRGSKAIPFSEVTPRPSTPTTIANITDVIHNYLVGDNQTSHISMVNRMMNSLQDNGLTVKVYPSSGKNSRYELVANGKVVESGITSASKAGFEATPQLDYNVRQLRTQALQEAVDSKKSNDIVARSNNNDPLWMLKQVFKSSDGKELDDYQAVALRKALQNYQDAYQSKSFVANARNVDEIFSKTVKGKTVGLDPAIALITKIKKAGASITPFQEKLLALADEKGKGFKTVQADIVKADKAGATAVREKFKQEPSKALNTIRGIAIKARQDYNSTKNYAKKKEAAQRVSDYFDANRKKFNKTDLTQIARWNSISDEANIAHGPQYRTPVYIRRSNTLTNADPEVAKTYYEASEKAIPPAEKYSNLAKQTAKTTTKPVEEPLTTMSGIQLKKETTPAGDYWLEQNVAKSGGKWTPVVKAGHTVEHLMLKGGGGYAGKVRIDGVEYTYPEAEAKFLNPVAKYNNLAKTVKTTMPKYTIGATFDYEGKKWEIKDFPGLKLVTVAQVDNPNITQDLSRSALLSGDIGTNLKNPTV